jgi:hypothetical protein
MRNAFEMGSGAMIYILSFIKIGSGNQIFIGNTQTACCSHKTTFIFLSEYGK